jgi:hypothetical protein
VHAMAATGEEKCGVARDGGTVGDGSGGEAE